MKFSIDQISWMCREVERQLAAPTFVEGMAHGVRRATNLYRDHTTFEDIILINQDVLMKPVSGFRMTPVTFQSGGGSAAPDVLPQACRGLERAIIDVEKTQEDVDRWIKVFLWTHPFEDGNGRTAAILRNWFLERLHDPIDLPNYDW